MRAGIVGGGFIGGVHRLALQSLGVEVAWVAGRRDDLHALLDDERVDVLHVCTPNDVHAGQALAALERGIHVVCEKPLAISSDECEALVAAADGLVNAVCYHSRSYPLVEHMRAEVATGAIGEITFVHGRYLCDDVQLVNAYDESFARELKHFHACITEGAECRTPPEGARLDIDVLTKMFHLPR